jgi:hypothetical protein
LWGIRIKGEITSVCFWHIASVCPGLDYGRFRRKADIVRHWRRMGRSLMTQSGHAMRRLGQVDAAGEPYAAPVKAESSVT